MLWLRQFLVELTVLVCAFTSLLNADRSFIVDYDKNVFLKDGQPYRYISGEIHYFRIHPSLWQDRLQRVRAAGLNAVQVYIPWNFHEIMAGVVDFQSPEKNLTHFLQLAQQNSLDVLLRIGPYVCAEWENGGLPWWLLRHPNISMRTSDPKYKEEVKKYFNVMLPIVKPLLYKNGGPVIMLQIENEYGSFCACDHDYMKWLRDLVHGVLGEDTQLYTTDGPSQKLLDCGSVKGVFATVDFGVSSSLGIQNNFYMQKKINGGPYTNSEFYTVWFTGWGGKLLDLGWGAPGFTQNTSFSLNNVIENTVNSMADMYKMNASFSFYMIHGGTNFGFWSGDESTGPVITSYDYSAPISEAGQITPLYLAIRNFIKNLTNWPNPPLEVPQNHTAVAIDNVKTVRVGSLITVVQNSLNKDHCKQSETPLSFEVLDNQYDLVLYSSVLPKVVDGSHLMLTIPDLHDYAYVFVDDVYQGHLAIDQEYTHAFARLTLPLKNGTTGSKLDILVENHGRRTFETINDYKGILSNVTVNKQLITNWMQCGVNPSKLYSKAKEMWSQKTAVVEDGSPAVYVGTFESDVAWDDYHTFFDARKWNKGFVIVNNFNLGRYWTSMGPQMTLYAPGAIFQKHQNTIVVVELVGQTSSSTQQQPPSINFLKEPSYEKKQIPSKKQMASSSSSLFVQIPIIIELTGYLLFFAWRLLL